MELAKKLIDDYEKRYGEKQSENNRELENYIKSHIRTDFLTKDVFGKILEWKSKRIGKRKEMDEKFIKEITKISFSTENERLKIEILSLLNGVGYRTASAILRFVFPNKYGVMDYRVWNSLKKFGKINGEIKNDFESWWGYLTVCRNLAKEFNVSLVTLDRALWQFHKEEIEIKK